MISSAKKPMNILKKLKVIKWTSGPISLISVPIVPIQIAARIANMVLS